MRGLRLLENGKRSIGERGGKAVISGARMGNVRRLTSVGAAHRIKTAEDFALLCCPLVQRQDS